VTACDIGASLVFEALTTNRQWKRIVRGRHGATSVGNHHDRLVSACSSRVSPCQMAGSNVMLGTSLDLPAITIVVVGAVIGGFVTGLAGFGTALVALGLWLHALPATMVPPLVALSSVAAHIVGLITVRKAFAAASFAFSSATAFSSRAWLPQLCRTDQPPMPSRRKLRPREPLS